MTMPSQDMILGLWLPESPSSTAPRARAVCSRWKRPKWPFDKHEIDMQAKVLIRLPR